MANITLWIDADACPKIIKEILYRASMRTHTKTLLVANQLLTIPKSEFIKTIQVSVGFDVADSYIVQHIQPNDLVITADIPLADLVVQKGGFALNPRGELYDQYNIKQRLAIRDLSEQLRSNKTISGGPPKLSKKEIQNFANNLDKFLASR